MKAFLISCLAVLATVPWYCLLVSAWLTTAVVSLAGTWWGV